MRWVLVSFALFLLPLGTAESEYRWERHLYGNNIYELAYDDGVLWWGTTGGLVEMSLADTSFILHPRDDRGLPSDSVYALAFDAEGNLWCGTSSGGIGVKLDRGGWRVLRSFDGLPHEIGEDPRVLALSGADGNITVGTGDGYVTFVGLDGGTIWGCTVIDPCVDVLPSLVVQSVMSLGDTIWLGTAQGAARHTPSDSETPLVLFADGLEGDALSVTALASFENRIWAGTMDGAYYFDADLELWIATDGLTDNVSDFLVANGMLIAANSNLPELPSDDEGVFVWNGTDWDPLGTNYGFDAHALALDGNIWCGTSFGVKAYDPGQDLWGAAYQIGGLPTEKNVWSVGAGERPEVWFGFQTGQVAGYDGDRWWRFTRANTGGKLQGKWTQAVYIDQSERVWFGHCCCDTCHVDRASGSNPSSFTWERIPALNTRVITDDGNGNYWMGSGATDASVGDGLFLWQEGDSPSTVTQFTTATGGNFELSSDQIAGLVVDTQGRLWIGNREAGVDIWDYGADPHQMGDDNWLHLTDDGLGDGDIISNAVLSLAGDGNRIWIGTSLGVTLYEDGEFRWSWGGFQLGNPFVNAMTVTSDRAAWAGTDDGLVRFVPDEFGLFELEHYAFPDLASKAVNALASDGLEVWIAARHGVTGGSQSLVEIGPTFGQLSGIPYPNPFIPEMHEGVRLDGIGVTVSGSVYDAAGATVATFENVAPGEIVWDGHVGPADATAPVAAPGIYAIVARSGPLTMTARVAVFR